VITFCVHLFIYVHVLVRIKAISYMFLLYAVFLHYGPMIYIPYRVVTKVLLFRLPVSYVVSVYLVIHFLQRDDYNVTSG